MANWTIGVEMLSYAVFPLTHFKTRNVINAAVLTLGTLLIYLAILFLLPRLSISGATAASYGSRFFLKDLPIFAFGAICFFIVRDRLVARSEDRGRALGAPLVLIAVYLRVARSRGWIRDAMFGGHPYVWPATGYLLFLVEQSLHPLKLLVKRTTEFLDAVDSSLYLAPLSSPSASLER